MPIRQDWVKSYARDLSDPCYLKLTWAERGVYDGLTRLSKGFSEMKGYLVNNGKGMTDEEIAIALRCATPQDKQTVSEAIARLVEIGWLEPTSHSGYHLSLWEQRQAREVHEPRENVAKRVRKHRAKEKQEKVTPIWGVK